MTLTDSIVPGCFLRFSDASDRLAQGMSRRLMTIPGVGPVVALTYCLRGRRRSRALCNSKTVGAVFGLTPAKGVTQPMRAI
jgi:hypothetical protein